MKLQKWKLCPITYIFFVATKPTVAATDVIRTLKSLSAIKLFAKFPSLKKFYAGCGSLWSQSYFVSTIGKVSAETIQRYIQEQKGGNKHGDK